MSYDLDLTVTTATGSTLVDERNITSNLAPMLRAAGMDRSLPALNGMTASEALPIVERVTRELEDRPDHYAQFNSRNGWGKHRHLLPWMQELRQALRSHPTGVIEVSA